MTARWSAWSLRAVPPPRTHAERRQRCTDRDEQDPRVAVALIMQNRPGGIAARLRQVHPTSIARVDRVMRRGGRP